MKCLFVYLESQSNKDIDMKTVQSDNTQFTSYKIYKTYQKRIICINEQATRADWYKLLCRICNKVINADDYRESADGQTVFANIWGKKYRFDLIERDKH